MEYQNEVIFVQTFKTIFPKYYRVPSRQLPPNIVIILRLF